MSYYTLIGAIVVPADADDPYVFSDEAAPKFQGSSRSGHFHSTIRTLLDLMPGHEALRFLSAEIATKVDHGADGATSFTLLQNAQIVVVEKELQHLLDSILLHVDSLPTSLLSYWGDADRIRSALLKARSVQGSGYEMPDNEDGDSPDFFFAALTSLARLCTAALDGPSNLLVYNWLPR